MSIRAYKVLDIKTKQADSFNLWHDSEVMDFLNDQEGGFLGSLNDDCCGITCAKVASIKELIQRSGEFHLDKDSVDCLKDDIKGFTDDDYIQYYCF